MGRKITAPSGTYQWCGEEIPSLQLGTQQSLNDLWHHDVVLCVHPL